MLAPRLNLGCGADYREGYWNVDLGPFRVDQQVDVFGALPWRDGTFQEIMAVDILEHTSWAHTERVLGEWLRVLAPGGRVTIQVPNLAFLCAKYLDGTFDARAASLWIYGGQETSHGVGEKNWNLNAHYAGFDHRRLEELAHAFRLLIERLEPVGSNLVLEAVKTGAAFNFSGQRYAYFDHPYNTTRWNERRVEVPLIRAEYLRTEGAILEVGNVLGNYFPREHLTVDKYEHPNGVIELDVVEIDPIPTYDLIVSISTLEHVGFDESKKDDAKLAVAVDRLRATLKPGGRLVFTIPLGYNPNADRFVRSCPHLSVRYLKRLNSDNDWAECEDPGNVAYGAPFAFANAVAICVSYRP